MRAKERAVLAAALLNGITIIPQKTEKGKRTEAVIDLKKMGRPKAEKPKEIKYSIRTDAETESKLERYCAKHGITKGEAYRKGIELLLSQSKEN